MKQKINMNSFEGKYNYNSLVVIYLACNNLPCNIITFKITTKFKQKMEKNTTKQRELWF